MIRTPSHTIVQGKSISKSDKELVESILGGEMQDAWNPGDGIDTRGDEGPYARKKHTDRNSLYRQNYDRIFRKGD